MQLGMGKSKIQREKLLDGRCAHVRAQVTIQCPCPMPKSASPQSGDGLCSALSPPSPLQGAWHTAGSTRVGGMSVEWEGNRHPWLKEAVLGSPQKRAVSHWAVGPLARDCHAGQNKPSQPTNRGSEWARKANWIFTSHAVSRGNQPISKQWALSRAGSVRPNVPHRYI